MGLLSELKLPSPFMYALSYKFFSYLKNCGKQYQYSKKEKVVGSMWPRAKWLITQRVSATALAMLRMLDETDRGVIPNFRKCLHVSVYH